MSKTFIVNLGPGADVLNYDTGAYIHKDTEKEAVITGGFVTVLTGSSAECSLQIYGSTLLEYFNDVLEVSHANLAAEVKNNTVIISISSGEDD